MHFTFWLWVLQYGLLHGQVSSVNGFFIWVLISKLILYLASLPRSKNWVAEISCWMWTGERQSTKMRIKYLEAALNQDIPFFDTEVRTSDVVCAINTDAVMVQDAISEKVKENLAENRKENLNLGSSFFIL